MMVMGNRYNHIHMDTKHDLDRAYFLTYIRSSYQLTDVTIKMRPSIVLISLNDISFDHFTFGVC